MKRKKKHANRLVNLGIPLGQAAMCMSCKMIINKNHRTCPKCGGAQFGRLGNWVKPLCSAEEYVTAA